MGFSNFLKQLISPGAEHHTRTRNIINAAVKHDVGMSLFFVDRQRQLENVICYIKSVKKNRIILRSRKNFLPDILNNEQCSLYFKLPYNVVVEDLKLPVSSARQGFLCKSRIISNSLDKHTKACEILIVMPTQYVQRELRRHERVYPSPAMIKGAGLWLPFSRLPEKQSQFGTPDFILRNDCPTSQVRLVDISAGGARVQIDKVDFLEEFKNMDGRQLLLLVSIYKIGNKHFSVLTACKCIESSYSVILRRLTLRLNFVKIWSYSEDRLSQVWTPVGAEGIPAILEWINNDFGILIDRTPEN